MNHHGLFALAAISLFSTLATAEQKTPAQRRAELSRCLDFATPFVIKRGGDPKAILRCVVGAVDLGKLRCLDQSDEDTITACAKRFCSQLKGLRVCSGDRDPAALLSLRLRLISEQLELTKDPALFSRTAAHYALFSPLHYTPRAAAPDDSETIRTPLKRFVLSIGGANNYSLAGKRVALAQLATRLAQLKSKHGAVQIEIRTARRTVPYSAIAPALEALRQAGIDRYAFSVH